MPTLTTNSLPIPAPTSGSAVAAATDLSQIRRAGPHLQESPRRPTSPLPTLADLSDQDRQRLSLLFRARADAVSFAALREEDPLESLAWLAQPHIKPWHDPIRAAPRDHAHTE